MLRVWKVPLAVRQRVLLSRADGLSYREIQRVTGVSANLTDDAKVDDGWWDLLPFTTHRIPLAPGIETAAAGVNALEDVRTDLVIEACGGSLEGRTVVDLGCLEGGFTLAFAERGASLSLGIEAREISVRRCELARDLLRLETAEFVEADIKDELAKRESFDVVFAAGILYHVADPAGFLVTMREACSGIALIDTHVARADTATHRCSEIVTRTSGEQSYSGRMFPEYASDVSASEKDDLLWAAWSDVDSFWPVEEDLVAMIHDAGFASAEKIDLASDGRASRWGVDQTNRVVNGSRSHHPSSTLASSVRFAATPSCVVGRPSNASHAATPRRNTPRPMDDTLR